MPRKRQAPELSSGRLGRRTEGDLGSPWPLGLECAAKADEQQMRTTQVVVVPPAVIQPGASAGLPVAKLVNPQAVLASPVAKQVEPPVLPGREAAKCTAAAAAERSVDADRGLATCFPGS